MNRHDMRKRAQSHSAVAPVNARLAPAFRSPNDWRQDSTVNLDLITIGSLIFGLSVIAALILL